MKKTMKIKGMRCGGCVKRVDTALKGLGIEKVEVSLENACAVVESSVEVSSDVLKTTVEKLGFTVESIA